MSTSYFPKTSMYVVCRKERGRDVSTFLFYVVLFLGLKDSIGNSKVTSRDGRRFMTVM